MTKQTQLESFDTTENKYCGNRPIRDKLASNTEASAPTLAAQACRRGIWSADDTYQLRNLSAQEARPSEQVGVVSHSMARKSHRFNILALAKLKLLEVSSTDSSSSFSNLPHPSQHIQLTTHPQAARVGSIQAAYRAHESANPVGKVPAPGAIRSLGLIEKAADGLDTLDRKSGDRAL